MAVVIPIVSEFDGKGLSRAVKEFQQLEGAGEKAQFALKKAAIPAAAALAGVAVAVTDMTKAAIEDAKSQELLALALEKNALQGRAATAAAEAYIEQTALAQLVQTTGSLEQSQMLLNTALDVSAATGTDLATVTDAMSKAAVGNMKALGNLVPSVRDNIKAGESLDQIMVELSASMGGAAAAAANTASGQMTKLSLTIDETKESIGAAFLPILERLLPYLQRMAAFVQDNSKVVVAFIGAIAGLSAAILALNTAMKILTAAQIALNFAMAANPVGIVVVAVAALIASFVALVHKVGGVKNAFAAMGNAVIGIFEAVANSVNYALNLIIKGINLLPGVNIPLIPMANIPRIPMSGGGNDNASTGPATPIVAPPDFLERTNPIGGLPIPTIPVVPVTPAPGGGGGGDTGGTPGGRGGLGRGIIPIIPGEPGGGGGGGIGLPPGNEVVINVNVNAAIAEASLADKIVDTLKEYNRRSGPLQLQVAG
jgi:hypothetical protein